MRYHTTGSLSEHIKETPEGYLLCLDVAIARSGAQEYLPEEVSISSNGRESVLVYRLESDVFAPETIASFEGKPVTLDHPDDFVTPETWRDLSRGVAQNLRRGEGEGSDLLLADLLITDAEAIEAVRGGLREISCGYNAEYEETAPGVGRQIDIIGNHVALVDRGRCGPRCQIRDKDNDTEKDMKKQKKPGILDRLFGNPKVRKAMDEAVSELENEDGEAPVQEEGQATGDDDRMAALEARVEEIALAVRSIAESGQGADEDPEQASDDDTENQNDEDPADDDEPENTGDRKPSRGKDSRARVADSDTVRRAKVIAPHSAARVGDSRCAVMRHSLRSAMKDKALAPAITSVLRGYTLDSADCLTLDAAFMTASELAKLRNNKSTADGLSVVSVRDFGKTVSPADINKMNRDYHDKTKGGK